MSQPEFRQQFPGSVRWRVCPSGIEIEGEGLIKPPTPFLSRARVFIERYLPLFVAAATEFSVPVENLIACALTESDIRNPETCFREEPGFVSDAATPHRVSVGLCQLLISTARDALRNPAIDRVWLFVPANNIRACAAYMKWLADRKGTGHDPILSACAYNAGGLYENKGLTNRWKLRQYPIGTGKHADRFAEYFNAVAALSGLLPASCPRLTGSGLY